MVFVFNQSVLGVIGLECEDRELDHVFQLTSEIPIDLVTYSQSSLDKITSILRNVIPNHNH